MNPYGVDSLGRNSYCQIVNHHSQGKKILILRDSFILPMTKFLAAQFSELHFMDIRGDLNKKDLFAKIEEINPDMVLMAHWPSAVAVIPSTTDINPYTD